MDLRPGWPQVLSVSAGIDTEHLSAGDRRHFIPFDKMQRMGYDKEKVQTMPEDKFTEIMASIMDLEKEMNELQILRAERIKLITDTILEIPNDEAKTALTMRFISRTPVSEIAKEMGYAEPSIYKFLNQGADWIVQNKSI